MQVALSLNPGGAERLVLNIACRLAREHTSTICCLDQEGAWAAAARGAGIEVYSLDRVPGFHPSLAASLVKLARRVGANVLHCHQYSPFVYGSLARMLRPSLRLVFTEHGRLSDAPPSRRRRMANGILGWTASAACAVSHELETFMVAEGFPASRLQVVHNGIEVPPRLSEEERLRLRQRLGVSRHDFVIGAVGRLDPVKQLDTLLRAVALLGQRLPAMTTLIAGDGPERDALEAAARGLGIDRHVRFLGHLERVQEVLACLDVFVNCSQTEGVSLTILEAMAAGVPVVATKVGGTPEIFQEESMGVLVPPGNPERLAEAVARLADDAPARHRLGAAGRRRVEESFSFDRMYGHYLALYQGRRGPQRGPTRGSRASDPSAAAALGARVTEVRTSAPEPVSARAAAGEP